MSAKAELVEALRSARGRGERPSAPDANLRGADLRDANLRDADLRDANLRDANLRDANLWGANLRDANLRDADLRGANLWGANLRDADLRDANLWGANLWGANLWGANLWGANLRDADLRDADLWGANLRDAGIVGLGETPSGGALIFPTPTGWCMQVGCWQGTPDDLRELIAQDDGWPEASGPEIARRRPYLEAVLTHVDLITAEHPDLIGSLAKKWGTE